MFEESLTYLWNDGDGAVPILIGGILTIIGFLIIPIFLVYGYFVGVIRAVSNGEVDPPVWDDWGQLFVDGLKVFVVAIVYSVVPAILMIISFVAFFVPFSNRVPTILSVLGFLLVLLAIGLSIAVAYVLPAAVVELAVTGRIGDAFAFGRLRDVVLTGEYATAWILALGVQILGGVVASVVAITVVGILATPFIAFYANVASAYLYARGVSNATTSDGRSGSNAPISEPTA